MSYSYFLSWEYQIQSLKATLMSAMFAFLLIIIFVTVIQPASRICSNLYYVRKVHIGDAYLISRGLLDRTRYRPTRLKPTDRERRLNPGNPGAYIIFFVVKNQDDKIMLVDNGLEYGPLSLLPKKRLHKQKRVLLLKNMNRTRP